MEARRPRGRPATGVTPKRNIRIGAVWDEVAAYAAEDGETMTAVIERLLAAHAAKRRKKSARETDGDH